MLVFRRQSSASRPDSGAPALDDWECATRAAGPHAVHRHDLRRRAAPNRRRTRRLALAIAWVASVSSGEPQTRAADEVRESPRGKATLPPFDSKQEPGSARLTHPRPAVGLLH